MSSGEPAIGPASSWKMAPTRRARCTRQGDALSAIAVDYDENDGGEYEFLTLGCEEVLIHLGFVPNELSKLADVRRAEWANRQTIRAGICMSLEAHWSSVAPVGTILLSLGGDPESSSISMALDPEAGDELVRLARERLA